MSWHALPPIFARGAGCLQLARGHAPGHNVRQGQTTSDNWLQREINVHELRFHNDTFYFQFYSLLGLEMGNETEIAKTYKSDM